MIFDDTIAAISTPPGAGAIAVVRLSGPQAWTITEEIFARGKDPGSLSKTPFKPHEAAHGFIFARPANAVSQGKSLTSLMTAPARKSADLNAFDSSATEDGTKESAGPIGAHELIDEVVVVAYKRPNSYTGEDLIEISCHGSPFITSQLLAACVVQGARLAKPGEFTQRAYINGRLDLTQAEAVLDLIQAKTGRQSRQALSALTGDLGERIGAVRVQLMELLGRVVAGIDFPEEVGDVPLDDVADVLRSATSTLQILLSTVRSGRFLRDGVRLAIVGKPNAGKSSLLNCLLNFERAIVTDVPGTTRDSLEEMLDLRGIPIILIDTAGIRDTEDRVEQIGILRTFKAIEHADLVLMVCDSTTGWTKDDDLIAKMLAQKPHFVLANKCDLNTDCDPQHEFRKPHQLAAIQSTTLEQLSNQEVFGVTAVNKDAADDEDFCITTIPISAKLGSGIDDLGDAVERWVFQDERARDAGASLNARQGELCTRTLAALRLVEETVTAGMPQDCLATDLKTAVDCLSEICGEAVSEEIITNIFATFCIGK